MLCQAGIDSALINGYANEEFTHSAVAAIVASGAADCGFGLQAAAAQFNLTFIPLNWESYWFILPKAKREHILFRSFIDLLASDVFKQSVAGVLGYDVSRPGSVVEPSHDLSILLF